MLDQSGLNKFNFGPFATVGHLVCRVHCRLQLTAAQTAESLSNNIIFPLGGAPHQHSRDCGPDGVLLCTE